MKEVVISLNHLPLNNVTEQERIVRNPPAAGAPRIRRNRNARQPLASDIARKPPPVPAHAGVSVDVSPRTLVSKTRAQQQVREVETPRLLYTRAFASQHGRSSKLSHTQVEHKPSFHAHDNTEATRDYVINVSIRRTPVDRDGAAVTSLREPAGAVPSNTPRSGAFTEASWYTRSGDDLDCCYD